VKRRAFLKTAAAATALGGLRSGAAFALEGEAWLDLRALAVVLPANPTPRESMAARVLLEESAKRCGLEWTLGGGEAQQRVSVYVGTRSSWSHSGGQGTAELRDVSVAARFLKADLRRRRAGAAIRGRRSAALDRLRAPGGEGGHTAAAKGIESALPGAWPPAWLSTQD
jgi:hypothetical protein